MDLWLFPLSCYRAILDPNRGKSKWLHEGGYLFSNQLILRPSMVKHGH
jgi:hypothetical protein